MGAKATTLVALLLLCSSVTFAALPTTSNLDCPYEPLPDSLNGVSGLGFNGELHIHNRYYTPYRPGDSKTVTFSVQEMSEFRIYVEPHYVDIDIWLFDAAGNHLQHTADYSLSDEVIFYTLPPGSYKFQLIFFFTPYTGSCPTTIVEYSIVPSARLAARVTAASCPQTIPNYPNLDLSQVGTTQSFSYASTTTSNLVAPAQTYTSGPKFAFLKSYSFTLPQISQNRDSWEIEATLGFHFETAGLGLLVQDASLPAPIDTSCYDANNCSIASHNEKGQSTLKVLVSPSNYVLWIYDTIGERNTSLTTCSPFAFSLTVKHADQMEGFLNCPAEPFPTSVVAGIMDQQGYMYYREYVLVDLTVPDNTFQFSVAQPSYFRAYTAAHRIDFDLKLSNSSGDLAYGYAYGGEEGISFQIAPGNYTLLVKIFGNYDDVFCETVPLEIATAPLSLFNVASLCPSSATMTTPDFTGLDTFTGTFNLPYGEYLYLYQNVWAGPKTIISSSFAVNTPSLITAELGSNFLVGDIRISIKNANGQNALLGTHRRNNQYLNERLDVGNYTLTIATGDTQSSVINGFPPCAQYSLKLNIAPTNLTGSPQCQNYRRVPSTLNTPEFLDTSSKVHIGELFLLPPIPNLYASESFTFNVSTPSYFRFYVEPHHIDIDLSLSDGVNPPITTIKFNEEEVIATKVSPGFTYTFTLTYYKWYFVDHPDDPCGVFATEFSFTPITELNNANCTAANKLPTDLPTLGSSSIDIDDDFFFSQFAFGSSLDVAQIHFTVPATQVAEFRAEVLYNFVWSDLALRLQVPSGDPIQGDLYYNKNEVPTLNLAAGNYILHIYEPFNATYAKNLQLQNCVQFHLKLSLQLVLNTTDPLLLSCPSMYFPPLWNIPPFIHPLTGYQVDFDRDVLADVTDRVDRFDFTVTAASLFRLYVPDHAVLDIDMYLYAVGNAVPLVSRWNSGGEELIEYNLTANSYYVQFRYYGLDQITVLPPPSDCTTFRTQIEIYPISTLAAIVPVTTPCVTSFVPSVVPGTSKNSQTLYRQLDSTTPFYQFTLFTITRTHVLTVRFDQVDVSSGIGMLLIGLNSTAIYQPLYFLNHIYLNEYLPSGTYNLSFHDPIAAPSLVPQLKCANYTFTYTLVPSSDAPPGSDCVADALPTNLTSATGGSIPFGGPQAADGSIRLLGTNFVMQRNIAQRDHYITFVAPSKLYVRTFMAVDTGNTLTVNLHRNVNVSNANLLYSTSAFGGQDRGSVWILDAQTVPYVLNLYFTTVSNVLLCSYYTFELAVKPEQKILASLTCPNPLPSESVQLPPETVNVYAGQDFNVFSDRYIITSERYNSNWRDGAYRYTITITVASASTLRANIGYDFLVNDFSLYLFDPTGNNIAVGVHAPSASSDSFANIMNVLQYSLSPGINYHLILSDTSNRAWNLTSFCHQFSFSLSVSSINRGNPRILQVEPSYGYDLDPIAPLDLTILFSEAARANVPVTQDLVTFIRTNNVAWLSGAYADKYPSQAYFDASNTALHLRFTNFTFGEWYLLMFNNTFFYSSNGTQFAAGSALSYHNFHFFACGTCSGHGNCISQNGAPVCNCSDHWAGDQCQNCAQGYHGAGATCIANVPCNATTCTSHGRCSDSAGYPVCQCARGFTGVACEACGPGFIGYPNCTLNISDPDSQGQICDAPLLPANLSDPAYLSYGGSVHLQDWYYINLNQRQHIIYFTLTKQSLFRIYTEPHDVDIDIRLYGQDANGVYQVLAYEIDFGLEETIFMPIGPGNYYVRFDYYTWIAPTSDCDTFDLELAITPLTNALAEATNLKSYCQATNNLPAIPGSLTISEEYEYRGSGFTINAPPVGGVIPTIANYFWSVNITIAPPTPNSLASIHATIGYRFLIGDLSLLLETGSGGFHCNNTNRLISIVPPPGCSYGDNLLNQNTLHRFLEPGNYTLWIYEPIRQNPNVTTCSPFDFSLHVDFVSDDPDIFNCGAPHLPASLTNSEYMENPGHIHFVDYFLLDANVMNFSVIAQSFLRVAVYGVETSVFLLDSAWNTIPAAGDSQNVLALLPTGNYSLRFTTNMFAFCPTLHIEFALEFATPPYPILCPAIPVTTSPNIQITDIPFTFATSKVLPHPQDFFSFNSPTTPVIASYSFTVSSPCQMDLGVESDFLRADLRVQLHNQWGLLAEGLHEYNYNSWQQVLEPGTYSVKIVLPPGDTLPGLAPCARYNFILRLSYTQTDVCFGQDLPYSFNSMRYLGNEGRMNIIEDDWVAPQFDFYTSQQIVFSAPQAGFIRVFTAPAYVDVDLSLLDANSNWLTSGSLKISTEEEFTYAIAANTTYLLNLAFYNFHGGSGPHCWTFHMGVEIGVLPQRAAQCPSGGNYFPPAFPNPLTLPYVYDSIANGFNHYYQQVSGKALDYKMSFTLSTGANLYIAVGYDFLAGDLLLKLNKGGQADTLQFGDNKIDRNVLNILQLSSGTYDLHITEVAPMVDAGLGCSEFTFYVFIESWAAIVDVDQYLIEYHFPSTLDAIPFLNASSKVHLAADYFMFDGTGRHDSTNFTLSEPALVRVESMLRESQVASGFRQVPSIAVVSSKLPNGQLQFPNGSFLLSLDAGTYKINFAAPPSYVFEDDLGTRVSVQLAINTLGALRQAIANSPQPATCSPSSFNAVQINPSGYFQDGTTSGMLPFSTVSTQTELVRLPFQLTRTSLVYLQVGYEFLLDELDLRIFNSDYSVLLHGRIRKNINEIHVVLPGGKYNITISQPQNELPGINLDHCALFSYSLVIKDAGDSGGIVNCAVLDTVPWQLNDLSGGSSPFGGPISTQGYLHFFGTTWHVPQQLTSYVNFTVSRSSVVSVLAFNWASQLTNIDITIVSSSGSTQTPRQTITPGNDRSRLHQYALAADPRDYRIALQYRGSFAYACYAFSLQIDVAPAAATNNALTCTSGGTPKVLPNDIPITSTTPFASGYIDSFFQGWSSVSSMTKTINFALPTQTFSNAAVFTFSFNSLVTTFKLTLSRIANNAATVVATGATRGQQDVSGQTDVYSIIAATLPAGNYQLTISHAAADAPFANAGSLCIPYIFTYAIGPEVTISNVDPPSAESYATDANLILIVSFTSTPFSTTGQAITSANESLILQAFYLSGSNGAAVRPIDTIATGAAARAWKLWFPPLELAGVTFTLSLMPNMLFDGAQQALTVPNIYRYTTVVCAHGTWDSVNARCTCNTGYAGFLCDQCDVSLGYTPAVDKPSVCVISLCTTDFCGCMDGPQCRTPLGVCGTNTSNLPHCKCSTSYAGEHCELCAPGFFDFPKCTDYRPCSSDCGSHGVCNTSTGKCQCAGNYAGDSCTECASGFSGETCESATGSGDWGAAKTFLEVMAVLVSVALVAAGAFWYWRRRLAGTRYKLVSRFTMDDDEEDGGHRFPDLDNQLVNDEDLLPVRDEEDAVEIGIGGSASASVGGGSGSPAATTAVSTTGSLNAEPFSNNQRLVDM